MPHEAHMVILDGAVIVNMIKPRTPVSCDGYRVGINHDFFEKNRINRIFSIKSDFFD